jgi:hypothetical protein
LKPCTRSAQQPKIDNDKPQVDSADEVEAVKVQHHSVGYSSRQWQTRISTMMMRIRHLLILIVALLHPARSFAPPRLATGSRSSSLLLSSKEELLVEDLFRLVQEDTATTTTTTATTTIESQDADKKVSDLLQQLEGSFVAPSDDAEDPNRFEPLIGYCNVSYTLKARQKDNPVGGKWTRTTGIAQKLLCARRMLQHILPVKTTWTRTRPKGSGRSR